MAYSGGLDTSVAIKWLIETGYDVIAYCLDVGEGKDLAAIQQKALDLGAIQSHVVDAQQEFATQYIVPALTANCLYEGVYPLASALSRPLIAKKLVELAHQTGASAISHGCTGKGNDQARFDISIAALDPTLTVIAPVREWHWSREEELAYAKEHNVPVPVGPESPYSIDQNLWGRAIEAGILENPWTTPPEEAYTLTTSPEQAPDTPEVIQLDFEKGVPVALNGETLPLAQLIHRLNRLAGAHGVGRIDHIENRLVGIKSREVYECPAAITLITAHKALESLTLVKETAQFKPLIEQKLTQMLYDGLWFNNLTIALKSFIQSTQAVVIGAVRLKLYKGQVIVEGRQSPYSLYDESLATYSSGDRYDQLAATGFVQIWGLTTKVQAEVAAQLANEQPTTKGEN